MKTPSKEYAEKVKNAMALSPPPDQEEVRWLKTKVATLEAELKLERSKVQKLEADAKKRDMNL